jgi:16S rRNA (guanine1207-N2)-methyltransferase
LAAEIGPEDHVLDMGCGAGAVALAAAFRTSGIVTGVDANARAVECLEKGAQLNGLNNVRASLNADGSLELTQPVDIALANPPYFGDDTISQHFVDVCIAALRSGGALLVVTKQQSWYESYFSELLEDIVIFESGRYYVACGRRP